MCHCNEPYDGVISELTANIDYENERTDNENERTDNENESEEQEENLDSDENPAELLVEGTPMPSLRAPHYVL